jgi:hypothetical protein
MKRIEASTTVAIGNLNKLNHSQILIKYFKMEFSGLHIFKKHDIPWVWSEVYPFQKDKKNYVMQVKSRKRMQSAKWKRKMLFILCTFHT